MTRRVQVTSMLAAKAAQHFAGGHYAAAATTAREALAVKPKDADAINILGLAEAQQGRLPTAIGLLQTLVSLQPKSPDAHFNLACVLQRAGSHADAERHYLEAIRLKPATSAYYNNLGSLHQDRKDYEAARKAHEAAVRFNPQHENAVINLCNVYRILGLMTELEQLTQSAVQRWPGNPVHWVTRAEALFFLGRFGEGWTCYDWRFKTADRPALSRAQPGIPAWSGEDVSDKSLLLWTEQGPGDELMYATMLEDIRRRAPGVRLLCSKRMQPLFQRTYPDLKVFGDVLPAEERDAIEVQAPLASFGGTLRPGVGSFPQATHTIEVDRAKADTLRSRYRSAANELLVGIAWRSSGVQFADAKSVNLGVWGALFAAPGVRFVSLQYGDCSRELAMVKSEYGVEVIADPGIDPLNDLDGYAAQVAAMDLVVCSSNTAAHFAGAVGVPAYVMVPATPGLGLRWYWQEKEARCLWYGAVRLLRQSRPGIWDDVVREATLAVARALHATGSADAAGFLLNLAAVYRANQRAEDAAAVLETLAAFPGQEVAAFFELGRAAKDSGELARALEYFDKVIAHDPKHVAALNMSGVALAALGQVSAAEARYRQAVALSPDAYEIYNNLGTAVRRQGRGHEADTLYTKANQLRPGHPNILLNLATNLTEIDRTAEAIGYFDELLALKPDYPEARHGRSLALLTSGRLAEGWAELTWRHKVHPDTERPPEDRVALWSGQPLAGKSVLVWTEQGLGDEILTASMLSDVAAAARKVTLLCSARLVALFRRSFPGVDIRDRAALRTLDLHTFDVQLSISELGAAFRPTMASFPDAPAYLKADGATAERLGQRYRRGAARPVVGVSWVSANPELGALKSIGLAAIAAAIVGEGPDPRPVLVSLQYGDHDPEIGAASQAVGETIIIDREVDAIVDMDRFAAQVAAMDLIVTISNTTAHLAGALGVPTMLLLPSNRGRHWYWMRSEVGCPWYPSVNYAVQGADGDWAAALAACRQRLSGLSFGSDTAMKAAGP